MRDETGRDDEDESPMLTNGQAAAMAAPDWLAVETSQHRWRHPVAPLSSLRSNGERAASTAITKHSLSH